MICLVPNCQHPQSRDNLCRWHRKDAKHWGHDPELGFSRFCTGCKEWWPADEEFFYKGDWRCRACIQDEHAAGRRRRMAA